MKMIDMKKIGIKPVKWVMAIIATAGCVGMTACDPLEDKWWDDNIVVTTFWQNACPETGRKPAGLNDCTAYYYPKLGNVLYQTCNLPYETTNVTVNGGTYDVLVIQNSPFITDRSLFRTTAFQLPTQYDERGNRFITENPKEMMYYASMEEIQITGTGKNYHDFMMKRCLKEITFEITVKDSSELVEDCEIELSGIATRMRLYDGEMGDEQAILRFPVKKYGRKKEYQDGVLTHYQGTNYLLGVKGNNILQLTLTDARGERKTVTADLTSYLHHWNTESVTCSLFVDLQQGKVSDDKWSGGADDIDQNL